ncbi:MAG: hypothetical protein KC912_24135 [Proteobacteria bacterium]|nr:hypothetical protein [Pseudomonadota bacterium]
MRLALLVLPLAGLLAAGCGPTCPTTCAKIYGQAADGNCNTAIPGQTNEASFDACVDMCEDALAIPGDLGGYNPNERVLSGELPELENEKQAAAWMDCIDGASCQTLNDGYCAPLF